MTPLQLHALENPKIRAHDVDPSFFRTVGPWRVCLTLNA